MPLIDSHPVIVGMILAASLRLVWDLYRDDITGKKARNQLIEPMKNLRYGKMLKPSARCQGCSSELAELIGHPTWQVTCTNYDCSANHVIQGRKNGD